MRAVVVAVVSLLSIAVPLPAQAAKAPEPAASATVWHSDFETARQLAKTAKLDLLLAFTTADAAGLSAKLETEVLLTPEFQAEARKTFLLIRIDLPADESQVPAPLRKQNAWLRSKYPASQLPVIWLCEPYARSYAQTGYLGGGPKVVLAWMADRQQAGLAANAALMTSGPMRGIERAKVLAAGLKDLDDAIVATNFNKEMMEIIQLDADGAAGLKAPFDAIARDAAARPMRVRVQAELQALREQKLWDELDALVERRAAEYPGERAVEQCLAFLRGACRLEGRQDCDGALPLLEAAMAMAPRSELAPEIARLRQDAAAAVEAKARAEAELKAQEAKKKPGKKK